MPAQIAMNALRTQDWSFTSGRSSRCPASPVLLRQ